MSGPGCWRWAAWAFFPACAAAQMASGVPQLEIAAPTAVAPTMPPNPSGRDEVLIVDLLVNGVPMPDAQQLGRSASGRWAVDQTLWEALRFREPPRWIEEGLLKGWAWLDQVPGARMSFDAASQVLRLEVAPAAFSTFQLGREAQASPVDQSSTGAYVNYDLRSQINEGSLNGSALLEYKAFGHGVRLNHTTIFRHPGVGSGRWTRLDTTLSSDNLSQMRGFRLGDFISSSGMWGRPARMGGLKWGTDFSLRPEYVTHSMPTMRGEAFLPSTVELMVNQNRIATAEVPAGPFEWGQLPVITGSGELRLVLTDIQGRQQEITQPYLVSERLLRPGLGEFSLEVGRIREDYGLANATYGNLAAIGQYRLGLSDRWTAETRVEALQGQATAGLGAAWMALPWLMLNGAAVTSRDGGEAGQALHLGAELRTPAWSARWRSERYSENFVQMGSETAEFPRRSSDQVSVLLPFGRGGIGCTWGRSRSWNGPSRHFWVLNASASLGDALYVSAYVQTEKEDKTQSSAGLTLLWQFDERSQGTLQASRAQNQTHSGVRWSKSLPSDDGWGYALYADQGRNGPYGGKLERRSPRGEWFGEARMNAGDNPMVSVGASGSLVTMGGYWRHGRRVNNSFALVKVGELEGVPVTRDHHAVGRTGPDGVILVTDLLPYQTNLIAVDPNDLPLDVAYEALSLKLTPALQSGVLVDLGIRRQHPATVQLFWPDGTPLAVGTQVRVRPRQDAKEGGQAYRSVGFEGKVFEPDLGLVEGYEVADREQWCRFDVAGAVPAAVKGTARVSEFGLRCEKELRS